MVLFHFKARIIFYKNVFFSILNHYFQEFSRLIVCVAKFTLNFEKIFQGRHIFIHFYYIFCNLIQFKFLTKVLKITCVNNFQDFSFFFVFPSFSLYVLTLTRSQESKIRIGSSDFFSNYFNLPTETRELDSRRKSNN